MPTNLYGPGDNFDLENSHVLPALIRKVHEAKVSGLAEVGVWGSGRPMREFLHVDDMAAACTFAMGLADEQVDSNFRAYPLPSFANVGTGVDVTIKELAEAIKAVVGFNGDLRFDPSKPDGTSRKLLDVTKMTELGWTAGIGLHDGIASTYRWFLENADRLRC
jgi:GDP-L-fucose synthase